MTDELFLTERVTEALTRACELFGRLGRFRMRGFGELGMFSNQMLQRAMSDCSSVVAWDR